MQNSFNIKGLLWVSFLGVLALTNSCQQVPGGKVITVKNRLGLDRTSETIAIPVAGVKAMASKYGIENLLIKDGETEKVLVSQTIDKDQDGIVDEILFQTDIKARASKKFIVVGSQDGAASRPKSGVRTFSRFVPERTDDYTWENDRVAFRTYGPVAQKMVEQNIPGGTLTSGMDAWLKRVNYSIIDAWYKGYLKDPNFYHNDRGEGYDPYHVGPSRGIGGIGVLDGDSLYVSRNFISFKKIAEGPIRTLFELTYGPWIAKDRTITETKLVSLDLGSNLTRFELTLASNKPLPNVTVGITLHDKKGEVTGNKEEGWFRHWEPMDKSFLGTGIVMGPTEVQNFLDYRVPVKDKSHLFVVAKPGNGKLTYYSGFGWVKSGQFKNAEEWDQYLSTFAKRLASPLEVSF
jgi:hypothetical protein